MLPIREGDRVSHKRKPSCVGRVNRFFERVLKRETATYAYVDILEVDGRDVSGDERVEVWAWENMERPVPLPQMCPNCEETEWFFVDDYICGPCRDEVGFD